MELFDDLLKKKMEEKTHNFHFSDWKSFCVKAGIHPGFSLLKVSSIVSIPVAIVSLVVISVIYFSTPQPVSVSLSEEILQPVHIDTTHTEPTVTLPDSVEISVHPTTTIPVKRENKIKTNVVENEVKTVPIVEQNSEKPPKPIEYIRRIEMRIDTIKSENQLMDFEK